MKLFFKLLIYLLLSFPIMAQQKIDAYFCKNKSDQAPKLFISTLISGKNISFLDDQSFNLKKEGQTFLGQSNEGMTFLRLDKSQLTLMSAENVWTGKCQNAPKSIANAIKQIIALDNENLTILKDHKTNLEESSDDVLISSIITEDLVAKLKTYKKTGNDWKGLECIEERGLQHYFWFDEGKYKKLEVINGEIVISQNGEVKISSQTLILDGPLRSRAGTKYSMILNRKSLIFKSSLSYLNGSCKVYKNLNEFLEPLEKGILGDSKNKI